MNNIPNISIEYLISAMALVILYLIYYVFTKDSQYHKNIHSVATVVEELNREIFYLKKTLKKPSETVKTDVKGMSDSEIYQEIERSVYDMVQPLSIGLKKIEETVKAIDSQVEVRLCNLENGVKQISMPQSVHGNDDEKIISLYKQGVTLETISKELHISKAEVEFVLKINKIK
jgi:uncharacterized protein (UPF0333 family)